MENFEKISKQILKSSKRIYAFLNETLSSLQNFSKHEPPEKLGNLLKHSLFILKLYQPHQQIKIIK